MATQTLPCWDGNWFALTYCLPLYINLQGHQRMEMDSFRFGKACAVMVGVGVLRSLQPFIDSPTGRIHWTSPQEERLITA